MSSFQFWYPAGPPVFADVRAAIIAGLTSAQSETHGWNAEVKAALTADLTSVVRTSDTVVTITLPGAAAYAITASETITATVPGSALAGGNDIVADPTFDVGLSGLLGFAGGRRRRSIPGLG